MKLKKHLIKIRGSIYDAGVIRIAFFLLVGLAATAVVPSSGRASDFVKVGSPVAVETRFYGMASVYDRNPKQYEAWAVGATTGATPVGVLIYYNGSFWTKIAIPDLPPLYAVSAFRYLSGSTWRTAAWAVGEDGTILRKDPNSTTNWVIQRKYVGSAIRRCGSPAGADCTVSGVCNPDANNNPVSCLSVNGLSCTETDINDPGFTECKNWTSNDLKMVAAYSSSNAIAGGERDGADPKKLLIHSHVTMNGVSTTSWSETAPSAFLDTDEFYGAAFTDSEHWWLVGRDKATNRGRLWKNTTGTGWRNVALAAGVNRDNLRFTSVAMMLRKASTTTDAPLTSVVWIGAEGMTSSTTSDGTGRIVRFDENGSVLTGTATTTPVRSVALAQRASGANAELLTNGNFSADRQDSALSGRFADGWKGQGYYLSGRSPMSGASVQQTWVTGTGLITGESGKAFAAEPWQNRTTTPTLQGWGKLVSHPGTIWGEVPGGYPYENRFADGSTSMTFTMQDNDVTGNLIRYNNGASGFVVFDTPYQLGARLAGYVLVPNNSSSQTVTFRLEHPFGRAAVWIENDANSGMCETNGVSTGVACSDATPCAAGSVCTSYPNNLYYARPARAVASWTAGTCTNASAGISITTGCFDSSECSWGYCSGNSTKRCNADWMAIGGTNGCNGFGNCIRWPTDTLSCSASPPTDHTDFTVTFPANGGITQRECVGGADVGRSCIANEQCGGAGSCEVKGGGWYPVYMQYYQTNTGKCDGNSMVACTSNYQCTSNSAGTTCVSGQWCAAGSRKGASCAVDTDCPDAANACVTQYQNTCRLTADSCISDSDCPAVPNQSNTCNIASTPAAPLKFYWNRNDDGSARAAPDNTLKPQFLMTNITNDNRQSIVQEVPLTTVPGQTYQLTGRYKVEFTDGYSSLGPVDPRLPVNGSRAGLRTKCKDASTNADTCGYDLTIFTTNLANGVTSGTCHTNPAVSCKTNQDCVSQSAGTTCNAGWADFSATLTKQNRNSGTAVKIADDPGQSLEVECFAESGARIWCDNLSVKPVIDSAITSIDTVDVWAVGDAGLIMRNTLNVISGLPADTWQSQLQPVSSHIRAITAADIYHLWAAGDPDPVTGETATLFRLSPGNVAGWAWIGSASTISGLDPVGWVDFSCGNSGSCLTQPSAFGVNVDIAPVSAQNPVTGEFSGSAWLGSSDSEETADFGTCQNKPTGRCVSNGAIACQDDATCAAIPGAGATCTFTVSCDKTCTGAPGRSCANQSQCYGTCSTNQGFRCTKDSDCQIKCSQNPSACHATGWLSFDKSLVGTPPQLPYNDGTQSYVARFDAASDAVTGWARFQFGTCVNAGNPAISTKKSCFLDSQCGAETCSWVDAPSELSTTEAGWVKLRGDATVPPNPSDYLTCSDCSNGATPTSGTCKICSARIGSGFQYSSIACNTCGSCSTKRCTSDGNPCLDDATCGVGTCKLSGRCDFSEEQGGRVCFSNSECNDGDCIFGSECTTCGTCNAYGVSVDFGVTKNFVGYGYSPDLGWIDFSRVSLGGQLFLQTQFGDIYAGGNIGGPSTGLPPGFPGGSTRCNATYRIVSAGTITNFCSTAQPSPPGTGLTNPTDSPFIRSGADKLLIPSESNRYTSTIGTIDRDGLVTEVNPTASIKRNKYGDVVSTHVGDINLSAIFGCTGSGACTPKLGRTVYHITGNLTIDKDTVFQYGSGTTPSGAGTFVVDGDLRVNANMQYFTPSTSVSVISDRRALPSAAFLVKQDVIVSQGVSVMVGVYYAEQQVRVDIGDTPLTVSGLMIAQNFDFRRRYRGLGSGAQEASELVIYDGRLQTNTPPGLSAITSSFPNVQELLP